MAQFSASSPDVLEIKEAAEGFYPACLPLLGEVGAQWLCGWHSCGDLSPGVPQKGPAQPLKGGRHSWSLCAAHFEGCVLWSAVSFVYKCFFFKLMLLEPGVYVQSCNQRTALPEEVSDLCPLVVPVSPAMRASCTYKNNLKTPFLSI